MKAELFYDARHELAEGPVWFDGSLWWVNIPRGELHKLTGPSHEVWSIDGLLGAACPTKTKDRWVLATSTGFSFLDFTSGKVTSIAHPEADRPKNRFNDGKCDSRGRFWAGTMSMTDESDAAALYVLEADLSWRKAFSPLTLSNGLAWAADDATMYHIDTPMRRISAFDFDVGRGAVANRRTILELETANVEGFPDGMTIDRDGNLYVALWSGRGVIVVDPRSQKLVDRIEVPVENVTSCCFGGERLDELFITTARDEKNRESGGIFRVRPGVQGFAANLFG